MAEDRSRDDRVPASTPEIAGPPKAADPPEVAKPAACSSSTKAAGVARLRRLTGVQYVSTVKALLPSHKFPDDLTNPFDDAPGSARFSTMADDLGIPEQTLSLALDAAERVADELAPSLSAQFSCLTATTLDKACVTGIVTKIGAFAFRRPLTTEELDRYSTLVLTEQSAAGASTALRLGLAALLSSPQFTFASEMGDGTVDSSGRVRLTPYEFATALSYAITEGPPDAALMAAAGSGQLATPAQIRVQVERLFAAGADLAAVGRFFSEYFTYPRALSVFKDPKLYPFHNPAALVADTDRFVHDAVAARKSLLQTLLTSSNGFANVDTARSYGLDVTAKASTAVAFPAGQRFGILTHPSFLAGYSKTESNDPIRRGKFINLSLLCRSLPNVPPPNVPPLPDLPNATLRESLKVHSEMPQCAICHAQMDPPGMTLEQYDHVGRYRTTEAGRPVAATGALQGTGADDGPVSGPGDLMTKLSRSAAVEECFARHALRFWLARIDDEGDGCTIQAARDVYRQSGGDAISLFASLFSSESFLYRRLPQ